MTKFPTSWAKYKIGELSEVNPPKPPKGILHNETLVTFLPMVSIDANLGQITKSERKEFSACLKGFTSFSNGDVIMAKITPCMENGKAAPITDLPYGLGFGSTEFHVLRPSRAIQQNYLFYFIRQVHFRKEAEHQMRGAVGQKRVPPEFIKEYEIPLPPLPEQHRIVAKIEELFSDLDAGIESLRKAKEQLKIYRQSVLKWAFEGKLTEEWRKKNKPEPASELLKRIKTEREKKYKEECEKAKKEGSKKPFRPEYYPKFNEKDTAFLKRLPSEWLWEKAGNLFDSIVPNRDKPKTFTGNIPWITIPNLRENGCSIDYSTVNAGLSINETELYNARIIPKESVVMTCIGHFGIAAVAEKPLVINQQLHAFIVENNFIPSYLAYALKSQKLYFDKVATSTTIAYVNKTNCNSVPIPLCSLDEQSLIVSEIESRLSLSDNLEKTIDTSLTQAAALRQSILKRAFEGKLVPQNPNDEPAEKLLEKIKSSTADLHRLMDDADLKKKKRKRNG
jgi:type I restriction enzyme S subunit